MSLFGNRKIARKGLLAFLTRTRPFILLMLTGSCSYLLCTSKYDSLASLDTPKSRWQLCDSSHNIEISRILMKLEKDPRLGKTAAEEVILSVSAHQHVLVLPVGNPYDMFC